MSNLFEVEPKEKGLTCRTCEHRQRWQCGVLLSSIVDSGEAAEQITAS